MQSSVDEDDDADKDLLRNAEEGDPSVVVTVIIISFVFEESDNVCVVHIRGMHISSQQKHTISKRCCSSADFSTLQYFRGYAVFPRSLPTR
jgi:hypothetical protein